MIQASDIMRTAVATVAPGDALARAAEIMKLFSERELPVVEDGALVGIIARSDLDPHVGHLEWTPVRVAMTAPARTVAPDTTIDEVARVLREGRFNGIPVTRNGALIGMVSRHDVLSVLANE
jgi:CBS domain-containing protein